MKTGFIGLGAMGMHMARNLAKANLLETVFNRTVSKTESIKKGTDIIGSRVKARIVKNKVAPSCKVAEFDIMFNSGISKESDIVDIGAELGIIQKSGAFYSFNDIKLGQGKENAKSFLSENVEVSSQIQNLIAENIA